MREIFKEQENSMHWRLHKALMGDRLSEALAWIAAQGDSCEVVDGGRRDLPPPQAVDGPALALTTLVDARGLQWGAVPGVFWSRQTYELAHYLSMLPQDLPVLNREGAFLTVAMLEHPPYWLGGKVFVRPNSGQKSFPGQVLQGADEKDWRLNWHIWKNTYHLAGDELCWCAPAKAMPPIEWRVWIVQGQIAAWSPYCWLGDPVPWAPLPEPVAVVAQTLARNSWQSDLAYVADFAEVDSKAWLLELNAASTSGLYRVPMQNLMPALRAAAIAAYAEVFEG